MIVDNISVSIGMSVKIYHEENYRSQNMEML